MIPAVYCGISFFPLPLRLSANGLVEEERGRDEGMIFLKNYFTRTTEKIDIISVHADVVYAIRDAGATEGLVTIAAPAPGAAITVLEPLDDAIQALKEALAVYPGEGTKAVTRRKEEVDVGACIKAAMLGRSLSLPFKDGKLLLAARDEVTLIDCESTGKRREYVVQVISEEGGGEEGGIAMDMLGGMEEE